MPRRRSRVVAIAVSAVAAGVVAGCNAPRPADLFLVERTGSIPGARLTLRLTDDGGAYCNRQKRAELTSAQLISARAIRRELDGGDDSAGNDDDTRALAKRHVNLKPAAGITSYQYRVRSQQGEVAFADTSKGQPQTFYRLAQLTREIAIRNCKLPR
ncbi:hypothetical protein [Conexibacter woesei]|uniref:hypothetical protein n=1 Tax=Conexibacter woesei TaxID=191495 RepID=UPI0004038D22|nr:hypothetical protein [Conexibacter woesei]